MELVEDKYNPTELEVTSYTVNPKKKLYQLKNKTRLTQN